MLEGLRSRFGSANVWMASHASPCKQADPCPRTPPCAGLLHHDAIHAASSVSELASPSVNIVHVRRRAPSWAPSSCCEALLPAGRMVERQVVKASKPEAAAEALVQGLQHAQLQQAVFEDVCSISHALGSLGGTAGRGGLRECQRA